MKEKGDTAMDLHAIVQSITEVWAGFMGYQTLDFIWVFLFVGMFWLFFKRKVSVQFGYWLFVLILIKLWIPSQISVPGLIQHYFDSPAEQSTITSFGDFFFRILNPVEAYRAVKDSADSMGNGSTAAVRESLTGLSPGNYVFLLWSIVTVILLIRFLWIEWKTYRLIQQCRAIDLKSFPLDLKRLQKLAQTKKTIRWLSGSWVKSPLAYGLFKPVIVIPSNMIEQFTPNQLRWVLLHELAHIRRKDAFISILQNLSQIIFFFNPFVWWLNAIIHKLREYACDDEALSRSRISQSDCGESFLKIVMLTNNIPQLLPVGLGLIDYKTMVKNRLLRIMDVDRSLSSRLSSWAILSLTVITLMIMPLGGRLAIAQVGEWLKLPADPTNSPAPRCLYRMVYDEHKDLIIIHGGWGGSTLGDTWAWHGATNTWEKLSSNGPNLFGYGLAYDPNRDVTVLTGGFHEYAENNPAQTWELNGQHWELIGIENTPLVAQGMAYHPGRKTIIRNGGLIEFDNSKSKATATSKTMEWDGQQWNQLTDGPALGDCSMVYDSVRDKMVIFGGVKGWGMVSNETWEFDGATWTKVADTGPEGRHGYGMVFDSQRGASVLVGGCLWKKYGFSSTTIFHDMWQWNGTEWTQINSECPSENNYWASMAYDSNKHQIVLFGGIGSEERRTNDIWLFSSPTGILKKMWLLY